jgi:hypothetical protein
LTNTQLPRIPLSTFLTEKDGEEELITDIINTCIAGLHLFHALNHILLLIYGKDGKDRKHGVVQTFCIYEVIVICS